MQYLLSLLLCIALCCSSVFAASGFSCPSCVKTRLGKVEVVGGPAASWFDSYTNFVKIGQNIKGYTANGDTYLLYNGTSLASPRPLPMNIVLAGNYTSSNYDNCGVWLNSAIVENSTLIRGWYHAEGQCDYNVGNTHKSVAYCESTDGGLTYKKVGYPNNQVITGSLNPTPGQVTGNGDHSVILHTDGYYYMFYVDWEPYKSCVARATKASGGKRGSWMKFHNGGWTQPGIGGTCTDIPGLHGQSVRATSTGGFLSVTAYQDGTLLNFGNSPTVWNEYPEYLMFTGGVSFVRDANAPEHFEYTNFIPFDGSSGPLGNEFWLYYVYLNAGDDWDKRYLIRRKVNYQVLSTAPTVQAAVELSRWVKGSDYWTTVQMVPSGYTYNANLGYVATTQKTGMIPLFDCEIQIWKSHVLTPWKEDCADPTDNKLIRQLGYIYQNQVTGTRALYRCFNGATNKHYASITSNCDGRATMEFVLGYILTA